MLVACIIGYFSLVIEEMVIKQPRTSEPSSDMAEVSPLVSQINQGQLKEQAIASLSSGRPRWIDKKLTGPKRDEVPLHAKNIKTNGQGTRRRRSMALEDSNLKVPIDFEVGENFGLQQQSQKQGESLKVKVESTNDDAVKDSQDSQVESSIDSKLNWPEDDKNKLLGAYFVTYAICQIPAGRAAEIFGAKTLLLIMGFGTSLSSLLFPYAARWTEGIWSAYAIRLVIGACQAGQFPAIYVLLCEWLPKRERSNWLAVPSAMGRVGTIMMYLLAPIILVNFNWQAVFVISGCVTLVWSVLFLVFGSDSPATSKWLSNRELLHIESRMEPRVGTISHASQSSLGIGDREQLGTGLGRQAASLSSGQQRSASSSIDWIKVIKNRPVLVLTLVMFSSDWTNMLLLTKLPGFLSSAMLMDVAEIGMWNSLLVTVYCIQYPLSGIVASRLEAANIRGLSSLNVRKLFEALAHALQALGCLMIAIFNGKTVVLVALFIIMLGRSTTGGGQCQMPPELSKEFPGTVMALANSGSSFAGVIGPQVITWMVPEANSYDSWRNLWFFSAGLFLFAGIIFILFADNEPQDLSRRFSSGFRSPSQLVLPPYIPPLDDPMGLTEQPATTTTTRPEKGPSGESGPFRSDRHRRNRRGAAVLQREAAVLSQASSDLSRPERAARGKGGQRSLSLTRQI